jgi:hypothetical protein
LQEKLNGVKDFIFEIAGPTKQPLGNSASDSKSISIHSLIIGALEQAFISMVCRLRNSSVLSRLPLLCNSQELQIKLSY